jgi:hypothetical protein
LAGFGAEAAGQVADGFVLGKMFEEGATFDGLGPEVEFLGGVAE